MGGYAPEGHFQLGANWKPENRLIDTLSSLQNSLQKHEANWDPSQTLCPAGDHGLASSLWETLLGTHRGQAETNSQGSSSREGHQKKFCYKTQYATHPGMEAQWRRVSPLLDSEMEQVWDEEITSWATIRDFDLWELNVPNDYPNHAVLGKMVAVFRGWFSASNCKGAGIRIAIPGPRNGKQGKIKSGKKQVPPRLLTALPL